jgi:NAD(P)-dependent dehydrogenase (short-subunit alcohol dehydrogenase family)
MRVTNAFLPFLREAKRGIIVNIASESGSYAEPTLGLYATTKAALDMYTDCLNFELNQFGIKAIAIQPGLAPRSISASLTPSQRVRNLNWHQLPSNRPFSETASLRQYDVRRGSHVCQASRNSESSRSKNAGRRNAHRRSSWKGATKSLCLGRGCIDACRQHLEETTGRIGRFASLSGSHSNSSLGKTGRNSQ